MPLSQAIFFYTTHFQDVTSSGGVSICITQMLQQSWTFMVLHRVLVRGPITAIVAVSPRWKVNIFGRCFTGVRCVSLSSTKSLSSRLKLSPWTSEFTHSHVPMSLTAREVQVYLPDILRRKNTSNSIMEVPALGHNPHRESGMKGVCFPSLFFY